MLRAIFVMVKLLLLAPFHLGSCLAESCKRPISKNKKRISILHMNCWMNGGGEKVLWTFINGLLKQRNSYEVNLIYDGKVPKAKMLESVAKFFAVEIKPEDLQTTVISDGWILYSENYNFASRLLEMFSQFVITPIVQYRLPKGTDLLVDTMTSHFTLAVANGLFPRLKTLCYAHYPFTMLETPTNFQKQISFRPSIKNYVRIPFQVLKFVYNLYLLVVELKILEFYFGQEKKIHNLLIQDYQLANTGCAIHGCQVVMV